ncbi:hypothetical protein [Acanthopleuribacter pedis]|uniref:Uncharacterized protein n=1 Tax=Acanthopleuribacter pedis TaxID=442870 RepID=A0A8J7U300_9BACT|nr:hypothetical protein [Acanthopleuribacter pedis]MBO1318269.1 hypothetical protein [Acanthopleuribacter pedis]
MKYASIVLELPDNELFTPAKIFRFALERGLLERFGLEDMERLRYRIRVNLAQFSTRHKFPKSGDGVVFLPGQPATAGWVGRRWKEAMRRSLERHQKA